MDDLAELQEALFDPRECSVCGVREADRDRSVADDRYGWRCDFFGDLIYPICPDCFAEQREAQEREFSEGHS